ncbi:LLM class flavin-dependent oxidoreductase [Humitalea rosea]|nr:LLM class flavin-dependent oxidoreductase [Humitalea rosea]
MHITLSISGHGHHPAAWRVSPLVDEPGGMPRYEALLRRAEAALLDGVLFLPPRGGPAALMSGGQDVLQFDTLPLIAAMIAHTGRLGLGATVYMAHTQPFHTARAFAVLDNLSAGRTAWIVDLEGEDQQEADFGHVLPSLSSAERYDRAREYIDVAMKLWDSWEDDAVIADKAAGMFALSEKIHPIHHVGTYFSVRGPLTAVRPIQGHPVVIMRDASDAGLALAAASADVFLADCGDPAQAKAFAARLRGMVAKAGRSPDALRILVNVAPILGDSDAEAKARGNRLDAMAPTTGDPVWRFVGTAAAFAAALSNWRAAAGIDGVNILPAVLAEDGERLIADVMPILRQQGLARTSYAGSTLRAHLNLAKPASRFAEQAAAVLLEHQGAGDSR